MEKKLTNVHRGIRKKADYNSMLLYCKYSSWGAELWGSEKDESWIEKAKGKKGKNEYSKWEVGNECTGKVENTRKVCYTMKFCGSLSYTRMFIGQFSTKCILCVSANETTISKKAFVSYVKKYTRQCPGVFFLDPHIEWRVRGKRGEKKWDFFPNYTYTIL